VGIGILFIMIDVRGQRTLEACRYMGWAWPDIEGCIKILESYDPPTRLPGMDKDENLPIPAYIPTKNTKSKLDFPGVDFSIPGLPPSVRSIASSAPSPSGTPSPLTYSPHTTTLTPTDSSSPAFPITPQLFGNPPGSSASTSLFPQSLAWEDDNTTLSLPHMAPPANANFSAPAAPVSDPLPLDAIDQYLSSTMDLDLSLRDDQWLLRQQELLFRSKDNQDAGLSWLEGGNDSG
jgi:hypothetical protein